jgi:hypothetical protein
VTGTPTTRPLGRGRRAVAGAVLGTLPGLGLLLANQTVITGEAQLTIGVISLLLALSGGVAGGVLGSHTELRAGPMALGAIAGALPAGLVSVMVAPPLAPVVIGAAAIGAGLAVGRRASRDSS